jgi:hypothetical protein
MKYAVVLALVASLITLAYRSAKSKSETTLDLHALHLGMNSTELEIAFGHPDAQTRGQMTYILPDSSKLFVTLRDNTVASAKIEFQHPLKIEDPKLNELTLVQMEADALSENEPSWFFAGKPEEGLIYKITSEGSIESMTWVPPFTYTRNNAKNLQTLVQDFKTKVSTNL